MEALCALSNSPAIQLSRLQREAFSRLLWPWYRRNARDLPWRGIQDPYRTWLSEIMLQQTRVSAVMDHYARFVERFPTLVALALSPEDDVLAAWSGLGYYRRARLLHRTAKLLVEEHGGRLPSTASELRRLPGIGIYTSAAIASIAFGERIAVVDGNVERVLLRVLGQPETPGAAAAEMLNQVAQSLVPESDAGDHNQAMMELGATICLPRGPRCDVCPICELCHTRGEHITEPRKRMQSQRVSYALATRKARDSIAVEVLLQRRPDTASLMPGMLELPQIALRGEADAKNLVLSDEPMLRVRHAIVGTNYYVEVLGLRSRREVTKRALDPERFEWVDTRKLLNVPLTGLARKVLQRLRLMKAPAEAYTPAMPLLIGRGGRISIGNKD
jgi:A/G-specific adenine glycosylase